MSDLHDLCRFSERPIVSKYVDEIRKLLRSGIPATYTVEEAKNFEMGIEEEAESTTTPLHLVCRYMPEDASEEETKVVSKVVETLLEYGAGWSLVDENGDTPGCILVKKGRKQSVVYEQIVAAGVRAELLLRKVSEYDMEVLEDAEGLGDEPLEEIEAEHASPDIDGMSESGSDAKENGDSKREAGETVEDTVKSVSTEEPSEDPATNQEDFLKSRLEYRDDALVTSSRGDGVMMSWETDLMRLGCESLFKGALDEDGESDSEVNILNIGFGMGIIDTMINAKNPTHHYICEAHPDVLAKLRTDGWYDRPNVTILEGRWQDSLDSLLTSGSIYFNGIYYDTFSEHYEDMLELFNYIVGLLKPTGVFSFFNGLGADREVVYDVYKNLVELDLADYGLQCTFKNVSIPQEISSKETSSTENASKSVWDEIHRPYWSCPVYYHPEARFFS